MKFTTIQAGEFYNEYITLKESLLYMTNEIEYYKSYNMMNQVETLQGKIEEASKRLEFVLEQLEIYGVSMKQLVLLSCGLDA